MPFALASSANSLFQASKPAGVLPHCAASAFVPRHARTANAKAAVASSPPLIIQNALRRSEEAWRRVAALLGRLALRLRRLCVGARRALGTLAACFRSGPGIPALPPQAGEE